MKTNWVNQDLGFSPVIWKQRCYYLTKYVIHLVFCNFPCLGRYGMLLLSLVVVVVVLFYYYYYHVIYYVTHKCIKIFLHAEVVKKKCYYYVTYYVID